jgi:hypothetical protein
MKMFIGLNVKYPILLSDFNETRIFAKDIPKILNIKFHENSLDGSRVVPSGRMDGQTDMKLTVAFRNFAKAPTN